MARLLSALTATIFAFGLLVSAPFAARAQLAAPKAPAQGGQQVDTEAVGPPVGATPTPQPAPAGRRLHGTIKLITYWEDTLQDAWLIHVRLLIQNDDDVRLYPPDFVLTTGGGLGDEFKGLRTRQKVYTNHGLDYAIDEKEDLSACCENPKLLPADNQIVKVVNFLIPFTIPNHDNWRIAWHIQPPPTGDEAPSAGPGDAPSGRQR